MNETINNTYWLEKYRPKQLSDYYMSKIQLNVVKEWIKDFRTNTEDAKPFLILHGSPGIGKTTLAYLILEHYNYEIIECNASDNRTKKTIYETLGQISKVSVCMDDNNNFKQTSIVMDEIDGLNGGEYNSIQEIIDIITKDKDNKKKINICPVICTCNSIKHKKLQLLMKYAVVLNINKPTNKDCLKLINKISIEEKFDITDTIKEQIIENAFGDYRQIILLLNDFYNKQLATYNDKNYNETIEVDNNETIEVDNNETIKVYNNETIKVYNNETIKVYNNENDDDTINKVYNSISLKTINNTCLTPLEKINYILTNSVETNVIETICSEDANIYYMNLYINVIPIIYDLQMKTTNKSKSQLLIYYKKLYTIYELLKTADLLNQKIFIDKHWELLDYFQSIGIVEPLQLLHTMNIKNISLNKYLISNFKLIHHSQYNFMRQEQTIIRKKINTDYTLSFENDLFSIYYYIKRFKHNNNETIEKILSYKKKRKTLIDNTQQKYIIHRFYNKLVEKIDELLL